MPACLSKFAGCTRPTRACVLTAVLAKLAQVRLTDALMVAEQPRQVQNLTAELKVAVALALNSQSECPKNFVEAVKKGEVGLVKDLLATEADLKTCLVTFATVEQDDKATGSALHLAADLGQTGVLQALLDQGIEVNTPTLSGGWFAKSSALVFAAARGHVEAVAVLLAAQDIDVNAQAEGSYSALIWAAWNDHDEVVNALLEKKEIDVNLQDKSGYSALIWASYLGYKQVVESLLKSEDIQVNLRNKGNNTALIWGARHGHEQVVESLLKSEDIQVNLQNKGGWNALIWAANGGYEQVAMSLLKRDDTDVNLQTKEGQAALMAAAQSGLEQVIASLLEKPGIQVNLQDKENRTALFFAARNCLEEATSALLAAKSDQNTQAKDGYTPLMAACRGQTNACLQVATRVWDSEGCNLNLRNKENMTAFMVATECGSADVVFHMLKKDAVEVNLQDKEGFTALMLAVKLYHERVLEDLRKSPRVQVDLCNKDGINALVLAAENSEKLAQYFLDVGPEDEETRNEAIVEAYMLAADNGFLKALEGLQGFENIVFCTEDGESALVRAVLGGQEKTARYLSELPIEDQPSEADCSPKGSKAKWTLLHYAVSAKKHKFEMLKFVLGLSSFTSSHMLNSVTKDNLTALQITVKEGTIEMVQELLKSNASVRHASQGLESPLRMALWRRDAAIVRVLLDAGASAEDDILDEDEEGQRLAVWCGVEYSLPSLVQHFAKTKSWKKLWKPPRRSTSDKASSDDEKDVGRDEPGAVLALANSQWMVHTLIDWQQREMNCNDFLEPSAEVKAALKMAIEKNNEVVINALCSRGVCERFKDWENQMDKHESKFSRKMEDWNRLHWSADSCDLEALSNAFADAKRIQIEQLLKATDKEKKTPIEIANKKCEDVRGFRGVLKQYQDLATKLQTEKEAEQTNWVKKQHLHFAMSIVGAVVSVGTFTLHACFLRMRTILKRGLWFASVLPLSLTVAGFLVAFFEYKALEEACGDRGPGPDSEEAMFATRLLWVGLSTGAAGLLLLLTVAVASRREGFAEFLTLVKQIGNDRVGRCWEKLDVFLASLLLITGIVKELVSGGRGVGVLLGTALTMAASVTLLPATPRRIALLLRLIAGTFALVCAILLGGSREDSSHPFQPYNPLGLLLSTTFFGLAWIDLPDALWSVTVAVAGKVEIEMVQRYTAGKFASGKLILGRSELAARGLEFALGLTQEAISAGLQDPIAAMEKEVAEHGLVENGVNNDLENFKYIAYGKSGCASDYPSAVVLSLETGKYHGGTLGPDEFDTGHGGRMLEDWMQLDEVKTAQLTEAEFIAVRLYTSSSYGRINDPLRQEVKPHPWAMVVYLLDRGIKKLRSVQAKDDAEVFNRETILWRGMKDRAMDIDYFAAVGGTEMAPMSTTTSEAVARHYAESTDPLLFKYVVGGLKTGVSIQFLSLYPKEKEFLYPPLTFLSLRNHYEDDGVKVLVVEPVMS